MILQKLNASSLLHAVFVCFLIATLCFGMILLSSYNTLFQKRTLQKTQLQLTNDAAVQLLLTDTTHVENGSVQTSIFSDHIQTDTNIFNWGFYKVASVKTYFKKDTIQKNMLIGKAVKPTTALFVTNYDKIVNNKGEEVEFKIIEFNKEFKRVVASHTAIFREEEAANVKAAAKNVAAEVKPTLGDANDTLQALKDKMEGK